MDLESLLREDAKNFEAQLFRGLFGGPMPDGIELVRKTHGASDGKAKVNASGHDTRAPRFSAELRKSPPQSQVDRFVDAESVMPFENLCLDEAFDNEHSTTTKSTGSGQAGNECLELDRPGSSYFKVSESDPEHPLVGHTDRYGRTHILPTGVTLFQPPSHAVRTAARTNHQYYMENYLAKDDGSENLLSQRPSSAMPVLHWYPQEQRRRDIIDSSMLLRPDVVDKVDTDSPGEHEPHLNGPLPKDQGDAQGPAARVSTLFIGKKHRFKDSKAARDTSLKLPQWRPKFRWPRVNILSSQKIRSVPPPATETDLGLPLVEQYEYSLLDEGQIRLFEIQPPRGDNVSDSLSTDFEIEICHMRLRDVKEKYCALSYVWGEVNDTLNKHHITVVSNESSRTRRLQITANLFHALKQVQRLDHTGFSTEKPRFFWADGICINQVAESGPFLTERERQVQIMHKIYSSAAMVIIDLGPEDAYTATAMEMISCLDTGYNRHQENLKRQEMADRTGVFSRVVKDKDFDRVGIPRPEDRRWTAWVKLMARPWFRRMWVAQEYVMARRGVMLVGSTKLPLESLAEHISRVIELGLGEGHRKRGIGYTDAEMKSAIATCANLPELKRWRKECSSGGTVPLSDALGSSHRFEMTKQVDRMYAVMSISGLAFVDHSELYVSYTESVADVYRRFNKYIIEQDNADALMLLHDGPLSPQPPSWSPDWSAASYDESGVPLSFTRNCDRYEHRDGITRGAPQPFFWSPKIDPYRHAFRAGGPGPPRFTFSLDGKCLLAKGMSVDTIRSVGPAYEGPVKGKNIDQRMETWQKYDAEARKWLKAIWEEGRGNSQDAAIVRKQPTMPDFRRAYARALIAATSDEYDMIEHQDYLDGAWSAVNMHRRLERFGILGRIPRETQDYMEKIAGLDDDPNGVNEAVAWDAFFLFGPSRVYRRRLCVTDQGSLCLCPIMTRPGDVVGIFYGAQVPYILQKVGEHHQLIGEAYVQDLMCGECLRAGGHNHTVVFSIV